MDGHKRKFNSQIEITDLIGDAVNNAVARRNQAIDSEDALSALSNEKAGSITGGQIKPIVLPITTGIIAPDYPIA